MGLIANLALCLTLANALGVVEVRDPSPQRPDAPPPAGLPSPLPAKPDRRVQPAAADPVNYPSFNSYHLDRQVRLYLQYLARVGRPDILIVGSSRALQGIDPVVLRRLLASQGYGRLKIYNFGVNGATAQVVELILQRLLTPEQMPRVILWADGSRAFNSGRIDQTYRRIVASQGYQRLLKGERPILTPPPAAGDLCLEIPLAPLTAMFGQDKALSPSSLLTPERSPDRPLCNQSIGLFNQIGLAATVEAIHNQPAALGFASPSTRFEPASYFRRYSRVPGAYDGDYRDFTLTGTQTDAFLRVVQLAHSRKIPLIFVNLPLTQIYLDQTRSLYEAEFRNYMKRLDQTQPFFFHDLSQQWPQRHEYFVDPSHLNRFGAAAVAAQLAKDLGRSFKNFSEGK